MWRLLSSDLTGTLQSASHTGEVGEHFFSISVGWLCPGVRGVTFLQPEIIRYPQNQ